MFKECILRRWGANVKPRRMLLNPCDVTWPSLLAGNGRFGDMSQPSAYKIGGTHPYTTATSYPTTRSHIPDTSKPNPAVNDWRNSNLYSAERTKISYGHQPPVKGSLTHTK